jgi:hypothetical protein
LIEKVIEHIEKDGRYGISAIRGGLQPNNFYNSLISCLSIGEKPTK